MKRFTVIVLLALRADGAEPPTFVDPRDRKEYEVVELAGMTWFGRNLDYAMPGSHCFEDQSANCTLYGRLYTWDQAMRACPAGWHLSTEEEWQKLEAHLGLPERELEQRKGRGAEGRIGDKLKTGGSSGLNIPFSGWRNPEGLFTVGNGHDRAAALWTATEAEDGTAWHRDISSARSVVWRSEVDKPYSLTVRCVKDESPEAR